MWAVLDYTQTRTIARELLLVKVSILGPEYLDDQLAGGPSHDPREAEPSKMERETTLAQNFETGAQPDAPQIPTITPSQALLLKHQHLQSISHLAAQFGGKIVDVSEHSVIVELTAKTARVEAFLSLVKPYGILEAARTGEFQLEELFLDQTITPRLPHRSNGDAENTHHEARGRRGGSTRCRWRR